MADTYCGKNCAECAQREERGCPGCTDGPGKRIYGECALAKCCREKEYESCAVCPDSADCRTYRLCPADIGNRSRDAEAEHRRRETILLDAPLLAKWLGILLVMGISAEVIALIVGRARVDSALGLMAIVMILATVVGKVLALLRLSSVEYGYRKAVSGYLIGTGLIALSLLIADSTYTMAVGIFALLVELVGYGFQCVGLYEEITAHTRVLQGADDALAGKWLRLRKWRILERPFGLIYKVGGGLLLGTETIGGAIAGLILILVLTLYNVTVLVIEYVCLYRTVRVFRRYAAQDITEEDE